MISWDDRIKRARERTRRTWFGHVVKTPGFNADDLASAKDWGTCAFGEIAAQHGHIDRIPLKVAAPNAQSGWKQMVPSDQTLVSLGNTFYDAVRNNHIDQAEVAVNAIRTRVRQLAPQLTHSEIEREVDTLLDTVSETKSTNRGG